MTSHCGWRCIISHKQRMWCVSYMIHSFCLSAQSCLTLCKPSMVTHSSILARRIPMDKGVWRATVHGVAKSQTWPKWFSRHAWTVVSHSPLSMEFSRREYWKDCHFLLQGIFRPRDWTCVSCISCIARWILYHTTTWGALHSFTEHSPWVRHNSRSCVMKQSPQHHGANILMGWER